ncbi:MAG: hypothetical protein ACK4LQ_03570 [Pararhodobacter sp.]
MKRPLLALLAVSILASCGSIRDSRMNPFNWFGASREESRLGPTAREIDNRLLVAQVTALVVERTSTGAILRAEGLTPTQGWWDAELLPATQRPVDGVMTYRFVVAAPRETTRVSTPQSRSVSVAVALSVAQLEEISRIVVEGAQNSRSVRR